MSPASSDDIDSRVTTHNSQTVFLILPFPRSHQCLQCRSGRRLNPTVIAVVTLNHSTKIRHRPIVIYPLRQTNNSFASACRHCQDAPCSGASLCVRKTPRRRLRSRHFPTTRCVAQRLRARWVCQGSAILQQHLSPAPTSSPKPMLRPRMWQYVTAILPRHLTSNTRLTRS